MKKILILILLALAIGLGYIFIEHINAPGKDLVRIDLLEKKQDIRHKWVFSSHRIHVHDSVIYIKKANERITLRGLPIGFKKKRSYSLEIEPSLVGNYIMDFRFLHKKTSNSGVMGKLVHSRGVEVVKEFPIRFSKKIERYQLPLLLEKQDRVFLKIENAKAGFISDPLFYKPVQGKERQFVFIIVADTLRWSSLGTFNQGKTCSPNLDAFAADSVVFEQCYSTASWTLPAFTSLFTGLFPDKHSVNRWNEIWGNDLKNLIVPFREKFITYSLNGNHFLSGKYGFSQGFDFYSEYFREYNSPGAAKRLFSKAKEMVKKEKSSHSLYFLHTYQLHTPYTPEIPLAKEFLKKDLTEYTFNAIEFIENGKDLYKVAPKEKVEKIENLYESGVYTFDKRFGEFLDFLKQQGIYDRSMIVFLSDHGEEFFDHQSWEHGHSLYNELIRIPLMVKFPGNTHAGTRIDSLASIVDVLPGILDYFNIYRGKGSIDGMSFMDALKGENHKDRFIYAYLARHGLRKKIPQKVAVMSGDLKLIVKGKIPDADMPFFKTAPPAYVNEMFHIKADPFEKENIIHLNKKKLKGFFKFLDSLKFKKGVTGQLKELEEGLKSLGYL